MLLLAAVETPLAADYEREVREGITSFKRFTDGARPQNIYAVRVDLSVPNVGLHASADQRGSEWYTDTLSFAEEVGAIAAINGDWSCTTCSGDEYLAPLGLAISGGTVWNDHIQTNTIGDHWGYLACTVDKRCDLARAAPLGDTSMVFSPLQTPSVYPLRYFNAIGANGIVLIDDGVAGSGCFDSSTTNPRSAACVEADGTHLWLVVVDGRGAGGGTGMSCDETRELLLGDPFLCWDAVMLDGGGSSTLVVEDTLTDASCNPRGDDDLCVKNNPSDGSPRTVANHLAITWEDTADARCTLANGRWCDGTSIHTCEGGRYQGSGDCAAYGAGCQEDGDFAFCVDPRCPEGNGLRVYACVDATQIAGCNDGQYGVGDCAAFGLVCGSDAAGAACMDARCSAGPHSAFCLSDTASATCAEGVYAESACPAGTSCTGGACVSPGGDTATSPQDTAADDPSEVPDRSDEPSALPGRLVRLEDLGCAPGCSAAPRGAVGLVAIACAAFGLARVPRRRPLASRLLALALSGCRGRDADEPVETCVAGDLQDVVTTQVSLDLEALEGRAGLTACPAAGSERVELDVSGLDVTGLFVNGERRAAAVDDGRLRIEAQAGALTTVLVEYGFPARGEAQFDGWMPDLGVSFTWPYSCANLFPCDPGLGDGVRFELDVTGVPAGQDAVFPRAIDADAPDYMLGLAVGDYEQLELGTTSGGTTLHAWHFPGREDAAAAGTAHLVDVFGFYETTYGPYAFGADAGTVEVDWGADSWGGMEHHPYVHVGKWDLGDEEAQNHEMAHGWFGDGVRIACWEDFVLSEGTTTYITARALEQVGGPSLWDYYVDDFLTPACVGRDVNTVVLPDQTCNEIDFVNHDLWSLATYMKGACFYEEVADVIGADELDAVIAEFYGDHVGDAARMQDMIDLLLARTDPAAQAQVASAVEAWLRTEACPEDYAARCTTRAR